MDPSEDDAIYELGRCRVDVRAETLTVGGQAVPLAPKVFATLVLLIRNRGRVMTREELMSALWPDTFVTEANLSQNVFVLRQALGDGKDGQRFIETVPRRGYRFVAPVALVERASVSVVRQPDDASPSAAAAAPGDLATASPEPPAKERPAAATPRARRLSTVLAAAALAAAAALFFGVRSLRRPEHAQRPSVAILGFQNLSNVESARWLGTALAEMLDGELAAGGTLHLVPGESVSRLKRETRIAEGVALAPETLARVRAALAADYVVTGSYVPLDTPGGARLRVQVRLQEAASGETLTSHTEIGADSELFALVARTAGILRRSLSAGTVTDEERAGLRRAVPATEAARQGYYGGLERLRALDERGAIDLLEKAVQAEPAFAPAHAALAEAWATLGYDARAREAAQRAIAQAAGLPREEALLLQARASDATNAWPKAIEWYESLWRFFPDDVDYGLGLANALVESGNGKRALEVVEALRKASGSDPRIDLLEAKAAESVSDFGRAVTAADRAVARATETGSTTAAARALLWKGFSFARKGRADEAIPLLTEAGRLFKQLGDRLASARVANGLANLLADKGDLDSSRRKYEEALAAAEQAGSVKLSASIRNNLGILAKDRGELTDALAIFDKANAAANESGAAHLQALVLGNRGVLLRNLGRLVEARAVLTQSIALKRTLGNKEGVAGDLLNLGDADLRAGDLPLARKHLRESLAVGREIGHSAHEGGALEGLAEVEAWAGDFEEAKKLADQAVTLRQKFGQDAYGAAARGDLAFVLLASGMPKEAAESARIAAEFFRKERYLDAELVALSRQARALAAAHRVDDAREPLDRALALAPKSEAPWSRVEVSLAEAHVREAAGDARAASRSARSALDEARRHGLVPLAFAARLVLTRVGRLPGEPPPEPAEALAAEARSMGFGAIASGLPRPP